MNNSSAKERGGEGDWVEIEKIILFPEERTASLPPDTKKVPLEARIKGFLLHDARLGGEVTIRTLIGREVTGTLVSVNCPRLPEYGLPLKELLSIGSELKDILIEGDKSER